MSLEMPSRHLTIIVNAAAGAEGDAVQRGRLVEMFKERGITADVAVVERGHGIAQLVAAAARSGSFAVAAAGGDGTVSAVASALIGSECALGVLPLGTLNHFAKDLRIPLDVEGAVHTIATCQVRTVDVGEVNGKVFLNNSSLGLYPNMVRGREQRQRLGRSKSVALFWATLAVLRRYPRLQAQLTSGEGLQITRRTPVVFIGNNQYEMRGFEIGSRAALDRGLLSVYVVRQDGPAALIRMGLAAVLGSLRRGVDFDFLSAETLQIQTNRKTIQVANDGEVSTFLLPLQYRIRPAALRVIGPVAEGT
jgi:diacylglycerol kinase family enzyme